MSLQRITCGDVESFVHICDPCNRELGRVRGVILFSDAFDIQSLIEKLKSTTPADKTAAVTAIEQGVAAGTVHLISETNGTFDGGSPQTGDGYGDEENRLLGYLYTLQFKDPSYSANKDFYETAESNHWYIAWRTETLLHFADKPASLQAIAPVEEDLTSNVVWNVTATWKSKYKPEIAPLDALEDYFKGCWENSGSGE